MPEGGEVPGPAKVPLNEAVHSDGTRQNPDSEAQTVAFALSSGRVEITDVYRRKGPPS